MSASDSREGGGGGGDQPPRWWCWCWMRKQAVGNFGELAFDGEIVPASLVEIAPIFRAANEVEKHNPRVAYLCRFFGFEEAHKLDPTSSGYGVRQFKIKLLQKLEKDNGPTLKGRIKKSDLSEMGCFYQHYDMKYIQPLENAIGKADRAQLKKAYQTANVLCEVLNGMSRHVKCMSNCHMAFGS